MTSRKRQIPIHLDVPPALELGTLRPVLLVLEPCEPSPRPPASRMGALEQYIAPLTRTRPHRPYDFLGLWLAIVPKRGLGRFFHNIHSRWFLSAIITFPFNGPQLMTFGLRQCSFWTPGDPECLFHYLGQPVPRGKIGSIGWWDRELVRLAGDGEPG